MKTEEIREELLGRVYNYTDRDGNLQTLVINDVTEVNGTFTITDSKTYLSLSGGVAEQLALNFRNDKAYDALNAERSFNRVLNKN